MAYPHLDDDARRVLQALAQEIAREFELDYVGTEHILLALLRHGRGRAAAILRSMDVTEPKARAAVEALLKRDLEDTWVFGRLPGSPSYRNVLAHAIDEAGKLDSPTVNTEHLLLALLREPDTSAARVLAGFGVTAGRCRQAIQGGSPPS